jgi:hypothetical protein
MAILESLEERILCKSSEMPHRHGVELHVSLSGAIIDHWLRQGDDGNTCRAGRQRPIMRVLSGDLQTGRVQGSFKVDLGTGSGFVGPTV